MPAESEAYAFGPYVLDRSKRALVRGGEPVSVTPKAFDLLAVLAENGGNVVSKETLMSRLWPDTAVEEGSLAFQISTLRKALGDGRYIVTVPGRGYQLAGPVGPVDSGAIEAIVRDEERTTITVSDDRKPMVLVAAAIVAVIAVMAGAWFLMRKRPEAGVSIHSIAVLPFKPIAGAQRDEALELGMADTLITRLSHLANVTVSPTSAVRRFNKLDQDPLAAARDLGVDSVLEGSLQRGTDRIRVTVRLLRAADGRSLWAEQYDAKALDLFAVEDKVADGVARSIAPALSGREHQLLAKRTTADPVAYDLYQKGVYWKERDPRRALEFFERALARDPKCAAAWAGIASAALFSVRFSDHPNAAVFERARRQRKRRSLSIPTSAMPTPRWRRFIPTMTGSSIGLTRIPARPGAGSELGRPRRSDTRICSSCDGSSMPRSSTAHARRSSIRCRPWQRSTPACACRWQAETRRPCEACARLCASIRTSFRRSFTWP